MTIMVKKKNQMENIGNTQQFEQYFAEEESDFFQFMIDQDFFENPKTYKDYVDRIRYVSHFFIIDRSFDKDKLKSVRKYLVETMGKRDRYATPHGISDLVSGLNKFLLYAQSNYQGSVEKDIKRKEEEIINDTSLSVTEKEVLIKSRIGQGKFRQNLINYWQGCSVTQCDNYPLLMASHIMPWRKADNRQRIDLFNGLLLTPNLDKLFDKGFISSLRLTLRGRWSVPSVLMLKIGMH